jgi:hypothetical protein
LAHTLPRRLPKKLGVDLDPFLFTGCSLLRCV